MTPNSHEEVFINSYSRLRGWAIQIARPDQELAEDLLHDAFIQFTSAQPELKKIANPEAYLYGVIRHLHLSHLRKKIRRDKYSLSIIDFETLRRSLRNGASPDDLQTQEELRRICYFLSLRKESSKSAGVMILRFFHGYFPSEISELLRVSPQVVKVRLNTARKEVKSALADAPAIQMIEKKLSREKAVKFSPRGRDDLATELRETIFFLTTGNCFDDARLTEIYTPEPLEPLETKDLAHLVSCRKCLDKVNALLGFPSIKERYAVDFIGKDDGGSGDQSGKGGMSDDVNEKFLTGLRRSSRDVFEHEPQELFVSINGDVLSSHQIDQPLTELSVETFEPVEFIEIFSEQGVLLAFLSFSEHSAKIPKKKKHVFKFGDDRKISVSLKKDDLKTSVRALFEDPHFAERRLLSESVTEDKPLADFLREIGGDFSEASLFDGLLESRPKHSGSVLERLKKFFGLSLIGWRSAAVGAGLLAALLIVSILVAQFFVFGPTISASEILQKTVAVEKTSEKEPQRILFRRLSFEEKNSSGETLKKRKIEIFSDFSTKISVKRLFDENDRLMAGEWRRNDGVTTIYAVDKMPELRLARNDKEIIDRHSENLWQLSFSAQGFAELIGSPENATVEDHSNEYRLSFSPPTEGNVLKAVLTVGKDLRVKKLTLNVRQNESFREISFAETAFEQKPREDVEKSVFEPNPELVRNRASVSNSGPTDKNADQPPTAAESNISTPPPPGSTGATPELEIKVLQLLNNVNALSGEQISLVKTPDGKLQIKGVVDAKKRKDEILNALAEVRSNPFVSINILTAEEAAKTGPSKDSKSPLESVSVESKNSIPAAELLRNHFAAQGVSDERIETEIRRFAAGALAKSSQMRRSALQMKQIAERFSMAELEKMDETAKTNWRRLVRQNAANLAQTSENLRNDLRNALNISVNVSLPNVNASNDVELIRTVQKIFELAVALDRDMRTSFSNSGGNRGSVSVQSGAFSAKLGEIIGLAKRLQ